MNPSSVLPSVLVSLVVTVALCPAQNSLVVPAGSAIDPANSFEFAIWGLSGSARLQACYDSLSLLRPDADLPIQIDRLRWRVQGQSVRSWPAGIQANVSIRMGDAAVDCTQLGNTLGSNFLDPNRDLMPNFIGAVPYLAGSVSGAGIGPWIADVTLTTPQVYDPREGRGLIVDIAHDGSGSPLPIPIAAVFGRNAGDASIASVPRSGTGRGLSDMVPVVEVFYSDPPGIFAGFTVASPAGASPFLASFSDQSISSDPQGIQSWAWDFNGDGVTDSMLQNPSWSFGAGRHTVSLSVADNVNGTAQRTRTDFIEVDFLTASFTSTSTVGPLPLTVQFSDTSQFQPTAWAWDFDSDGVIDSTAQNPSFTYTTLGIYSVTLQVSNPTDTDQLVKTGLVRTFNLTENELSADALELKFNEPRGGRTANTASTDLAPRVASISQADWQGDAGRVGFGGPEAGYGCLRSPGVSTVNRVTTGWPVDISGSMSVAWWHRRVNPSTGLNYVFGGDGGSRFRCYSNFDRLFYPSTPTQTILATSVSVGAVAGVWEHIALVVDDAAGQISWYIDGQLDSSVNFVPGTHTATCNDLRVGWGYPSSNSYLAFFDLDDFRVYTRALTAMPLGSHTTLRVPAKPRLSRYSRV